MGRVFITNDAGQDFTKAEAFGMLAPITNGSVDVFNPDALYGRIEQILSDFNPEDDHILLAGNALAGALAFLALNNVLKEDEPVPVRLLLFDARKRDYFVRTIEL